MEEMENKIRTRRFPWRILGAAVPVAFMLFKRFAGRGRMQSREQLLLNESSVDLESALNIALKYMPGIPVEVELDEEYGIPVWEVEVVPKAGGITRKVLVDARNGDILEMTAEFPEEMAA
ncbi:MAG: PepSY domain-containing protein [Armatimonadota bacterium]